MTDEELIARLRSMHWCVTTEANGVGVSDSAVAPEAADRIEALTAKLAKAVEALDYCINAPFSGWTIAQGYARATLAEIKGGEP